MPAARASFTGSNIAREQAIERLRIRSENVSFAEPKIATSLTSAASAHRSPAGFGTRTG